MGTVNKVHKVMCCPETKRCLLSVGRLLDQTKGTITFTRTSAILVANGATVEIAQRDRRTGLYLVSRPEYMLDSTTGTALLGNTITTDLARERITALHRAFGHANKETLRKLIKKYHFAGVTEDHVKLLQPCEACMLGKAHKAAKKRESDNKAASFGFRLCADCTGPFRTASIGGSKYLLVIIDEFSAWTWVYPMATLKSVHTHMKEVIEVDLHQREDTSVRHFRSDGGSEFCNTEMNTLLALHDIKRETTCRDTSYQNGKAERRIRTLFDGVRTCLSDAQLPPAFWAEAAVYMAYTLNRLPTEDGKSPFYLRYGKEPKINHMRPFGNPCVIYRKRNVAGKERDAGLKATFLGYGYVKGKRGRRVRISNSNQVTTSRNVRCGVFPAGGADVTLFNSPASTTGVTTTQQVPVATVSSQPPSANGPVITTPVCAEGPQPRNPAPVITTPSNAAEVQQALRSASTQVFNVGARVEGNWRNHGEHYDAIVTGVHKRGNRVSYDLLYDADGEAEPNVSSFDVRPRRHNANRGNAHVACKHALMTDCNPVYLAEVPDMAAAHVTPKSFKDAMQSKDKIHWLKAIFEELKSVKDKGVYVFVERLPPGTKALSSVWVFKVKCDANGKVSRFKARITVNGKTQEYGIDFNETFSPVAFATTLRLLFAIGLQCGMHFRQYDIKCAFLNATLPEDERVYMRAPPGFGKKGYWLLVKSLYGLKQAPMLFNSHLHDVLIRYGFEHCLHDPCLYRHSATGSYIATVVDDMVLASPSPTFHDEFYKHMSTVYDIKDLGIPQYVIGVRVNIHADKILLQQDRYIADMFMTHAPGSTPTNTPATPGMALCKLGVHGSDPSPLLSVPKQYRSLIGGLMYALITRPDVAAAVSMCARYLQEPREAHLHAAQRILRYLHHTRDMPLAYHKVNTFKNESIAKIVCHCDSSWANDIDTRRSRFGYGVYVAGALISWCSKLHASISLSTAEAEYTAATEAGKHVLWVQHLLAFMLPSVPSQPAIMFEDNAACRIMASRKQVSGRNKHFELKQHYIRYLVRVNKIVMRAVDTKDQIADVFTKPLARPAFEVHRDALLHGLPAKFSACRVDKGAEHATGATKGAKQVRPVTLRPAARANKATNPASRGNVHAAGTSGLLASRVATPILPSGTMGPSTCPEHLLAKTQKFKFVYKKTNTASKQPSQVSRGSISSQH